nr:hypothetical protein [Gluconobacter thailandicus]
MMQSVWEPLIEEVLPKGKRRRPRPFGSQSPRFSGAIRTVRKGALASAGRVTVYFRTTGLSVKRRCARDPEAFPLGCGMQPLRVVDIVDVRSDGLLNLLTRALNLSPHEFYFQGFEEALSHCTIPTVSLSAHGYEKAMSGKELTVSL